MKHLKLKVTINKRFELLKVEDAHDQDRQICVSAFLFEATPHGSFVTLKIPVTPQYIEMQVGKE